MNKAFHRADGTTLMVLVRKDGHKMLAVLDTKDYEKVRKFRWYAAKFKHSFYAQTNVKSQGRWTTVQMHRFIRGGKEVDHWDRDGLNNRQRNLRTATRTQNQANSVKRQGPYSSAFKGVYLKKDRNKFAAAITCNGHREHLGYFSSEREAARAYDEAAIRVFGQYARLNLVTEGV
jgi:hypothetical protein